MSDALTRSHVHDGRVVGWYGTPGVVIDAEVRTVAPPVSLSARFGVDRFWERWTAAECAAKLHSVPMHQWIGRHGLSASGVEIECVAIDDLVVSIGRPPQDL